MKKMSRIIFFLIFVLSLSSIALSDITTSITSLAARNAEGYLAPFGTMMGTSMNSGYYRKASPHKILGFDLTLDLAYGLAPPGQTTYDFVIPDDSIGYQFPFEFPKSYLQTAQIQGFDSSELLANIPDTEGGFGDDGLFQDIAIGFNLPLNMLIAVSDTTPAQNILGDSTSIPLEFDFGVAGVELANQVIAGTWAIAKDIPGIGADYIVWLNGIEDGTKLTTIPAAYDSATFVSGFAEDTNLADSLKATLERLNIALPIPGGFGHVFPKGYTGIPSPIFQASVGLPFHTEITVRGMPIAVKLPGFGTMQYGGFGGKIGISDYLSDILYKSKKESPPSESENIKYLMNAQPSEVNFMDVDKANTALKLQGINIQGLDSLNYLLVQGDSTAVIEIQNRIRDAQLQLESKPKAKKKKFPIDLALGFYTNDLILELEGDSPLKINSTNRMIALQMGKTFNMPFIAWLGGIGIYGGLGFESSNLSMDYTFANPLSFGDEEENVEMIDINLDFPGDNKFRKLIGARVRILLVDAYVDYNMGNSNNAINAGIGITFR